jgi:hypothetical protein
MNTSREQATALMVGLRRLGSLVALAMLCLVSMFSQGCASGNIEPQLFASPENAVQALTAAIRSDDTDQLLSIVGSEGEDIIFSGDDVADRLRRQKFLELYDEKHALVGEDADSKTLIVGNSDWPFPVPVVREDQKWFFDSEAGKEEILNRRIGENELSAIQVCKAIADAQSEYAMRDPTGSGVHAYAKQFASSPGKRDGLYWPAAEGEEPSPLGELAAAASAEGYTRKEQGPTPYHGYYYRILQEQGSNAPNGAMSYVVNDKMILGFAVVAYPADYDNSGIMTFLMGDNGVVYQKDLGEQTAKLASEMKAFDPDQGWRKVE